MIRRGLIAGCALIGLVAGATLATPASAEAALYRGKTDQNKRVGVRATPAGEVKRVQIAWRADCRKPNYEYASGTVIVPPFDRSGAGRLRDAHRYRSRSGRYVGIVRYVLTTRRVSPRRWVGGFSARIAVRRRGRVIDRCRLGGTRWTAKLPRARR